MTVPRMKSSMTPGINHPENCPALTKPGHCGGKWNRTVLQGSPLATPAFYIYDKHGARWNSRWLLRLPRGFPRLGPIDFKPPFRDFINASKIPNPARVFTRNRIPPIIFWCVVWLFVPPYRDRSNLPPGIDELKRQPMHMGTDAGPDYRPGRGGGCSQVNDLSLQNILMHVYCNAHLDSFLKFLFCHDVKCVWFTNPYLLFLFFFFGGGGSVWSDEKKGSTIN